MIRALIFFLVVSIGVFPRFRRTALANLRIAFGPSGTGLYVRSLIRMADNVCALLKSCRKNPACRPRIRFDMSKMPAGSAAPRPQVPASPTPAGDRLEISPPYVCVTGHLGPVDLLSRIEEPLNTKIAVVVRPPKNWLFRNILAIIRRRLNVEVIDKQDVMRATLRAMSEGKSVAIIADHNAGYNGVFLPFLGFAASTTRLPAVLALRFNKPVLMGFIRKDGPDYVEWIEKVIIPDAIAARADPKKEEMRILSEMNAGYTDVIRRYPEDWFWFHRRWKTRPGDKEAHILR